VKAKTQYPLIQFVHRTQSIKHTSLCCLV